MTSRAKPESAATGPGEQLQLLRTPAAGRRPKPPEALAEVDPVARVALDIALPHLDRFFDYGVPASLAERAVPGARVQVRFAGALVDGYVVQRSADSEHDGTLTPLHRVPSGEPVLCPRVLALARAVADRYAGTLADVLRLALPPRHAATEKATTVKVDAVKADAVPGAGPDAVSGSPWSDYPAGPAFLARLREGGAPRAVWTALPGADWPRALALAASTVLAGGRGTLLVVPDRRDVDRVDAALRAELGPERHVRLSADSGVAARYRAFLALRRGQVRVVVGTRAAMFAPVHDLGLVAIWDDGDDSHAEPHAPYPHVREVLALRAEQSGAAAVFGAHARTAEAQQLVELGWAREVVATRAVVRARAARVVVAGDDAELTRDPAAAAARLPTLAWRTARDGLTRGPVLFQVPRGGYLPSLACQRCRAPARCPACAGPLALAGGYAVPSCRWCGRTAGKWACATCSGKELRSLVVGSGRTAEELGRAFPGVPVRTSGGENVLAEVDDRPALVVTTPGAEPVAQGGYAAAVLLDGWALLARPDLRAAEEALRRWMAVVALTRPASDSGTVVAVVDASLAPVQALVRCDPPGHARRELAERAQLGLPPTTRTVTLTGARPGVEALLAAARLPAGTQVLGPVAVPDRLAPRGGVRGAFRDSGEEQPVVQAVLRAPLAGGEELARALHAAAGVRSARKDEHRVRIQVDPLDLG